MDLSFNTKMDAYYHQFFELQERLRKSEEERLKLEMRFNELVQISKEEEQAHYKKLRAQYKKFLEEDRKRQERNEKIIRTLERIESRVNMLTSKTERIKLLRRQYQSYLQRVSQRPTEKQEYCPPKIVEEFSPREQNHPFDYSKKSSNIAMLKKAYGKTNEEKIEILDKYLQSLKSQNQPTVAENKPKEFNELKYFDEVSKKLNGGFNSNEANSVAEEIMNSIYARHYKPDLLKDEAKHVSKFTSPNSAVRFSDKDRIPGENCNNGLKYNFSPEMKLYPNINSAPIKFNNDASYPMPKSTFNALETNKGTYGFGNSDSNSKSEIDLKENEKQEASKPTLTETNYNNILTKNNVTEIQQVNDISRSVDSNDCNEIEKVETDNPVQNIEYDKLEQYDGNTPMAAEDRKLIDTIDATFESECPVTQKDNNTSININISQQKLENKTEKSNTPEDDTTLQNIVDPIQQNESISDIQELIEPRDVIENKYSDPVSGNNTENVQELPNDEGNGQIYDEANLKSQNESNENEQTNQRDPDHQPIEQFYGEDGKALDQYNENEQLAMQSYEEQDKNIQQEINDHENVKPVQQYDENGQNIQNYEEYAQQYDENGQPIQNYDNNNQQYNENGPEIQQINENTESIPQYDENNQPIHEIDSTGFYDENSLPIQQYDESNQPIQHFDESGQPIQQYDGSNQPQNDEPAQQYDDQPVQQFDENGQPILQYDENGQPLLQYDENGHYDGSGQPIEQYDGSEQVIQQYDENGQPIYYQGEVQYDENGQIIQQYDENGQPMVPADPYQQYDVTGQPLDEEGQILQQYEENKYGESDPLVENKSELPEQYQNVEGDVIQAPKKNNVLDLLDTDSESVKQNTSKITNDSDFDFS